MATPEERETLRLLVQHVSRGFYEPKFTIVLDQLARHPVLKDDDLAGKVGLQAKELNKLMATLSNDKLVQIYRQNELKEGAQRSVGRQYYYIDYQHFCNVVKWRVAEMHRRIDSTLRNELDSKGYRCPQCKKAYSTLDANKLMDYSRMIFACEDCHHELVDNEDEETAKGSQDRMQRFNWATRFITEGLKKSEAMILPAFDVAAWVKNNLSDADKNNGNQSSGLRVAGSGPNGREDSGVGVLMSMDKDEATRKMERDAEAAAKRQQNALPAWHLASTVTGDLTALGVAEQTRAAGPGEGLPGSSSNDDILRGLGTVGTSRASHGSPGIEDVKPAISQESDYYDQYYASLAASSSASTLDTPTGLDAPGGDDFGDFPQDDEDQKPSIEYLDSLNDYRKRSRSAEDVGNSRTKIAKVADGFGYANHIVNDVDVDQEMGDEPAPAPADDPVVSVNGVPTPFSKVTEDDQELMTPEEYTAYYEIMQERL
ncbi:hypothetical protein PLICRDRAFT_42295 [Plicaturopsis crispa FD-325 SS-3]|nr:hypothetical protein PLICRDRAFT_42295 [Plicaturopsis crispa FD-325 SS-3]